MVAKRTVLAETGLCSNTSKAAFILLLHTLKKGSVYTVKPKFTFWISQQRGGIWIGDWKHREKGKQLSNDSGVKELERPTGHTTQENRFIPRRGKDSGRGIKYVRKNPQKSLEKWKKIPPTQQISAKLFISAFNFLNYSTTRITTCSWYYAIVHFQMAEACTTNLKVTALLKARLSVNSQYLIKLRKRESYN